MIPRPLRLLLPVLMAPLLIAFWYGALLLLEPGRRAFLPAPDSVFWALIELRGELWSAAVHTAGGALAGFSAAVLIAVIASAILSLNSWIRAGLYPYVMLLQMTPIVVIAPILVIWVGAGFRSVAVITFLICVFPMIVNTTQGLVSVDRNLVDLFRLARASWLQEFLHLRVPGALPYFLTGLRISATLAPIGAVVGDFTAGDSAGAGLGFLTIIYSANFRYPELFAAVAANCMLGFLFSGGATFVSWLALHRWHDSYHRAR